MKRYYFTRTDTIIIPTTTRNDTDHLDLRKNKWSVRYAGDRYSIDWARMETTGEWLDCYKGFIAKRFETLYPISVYKDISMIYQLDKLRLDTNTIPISQFIPDQISDSISHDPTQYYCINAFLKWLIPITDLITGDEHKLLKNSLLISAPNRLSPYQNVPSFQHQISGIQIDECVRQIYNELNKHNAQHLLIFLTCYELGLRSIQVHCLNNHDFIVETQSTNKFFSLNISVVKQKNHLKPEKRRLSISNQLGLAFEKHILKQNKNSLPSSPLFIKVGTSKRISRTDVSSCIKRILFRNHIDISQFTGRSILRHHLAQSLANQGSSAEIISQVLGHTSTVAANAYIKNTPEIAEIKTRALGKSKRFGEIIKMLTTGKAVEPSIVDPDRSVFGLVGHRYIGGIGGCGLTSSNPCPKNPIYSCYTCQKFHPFTTGKHTEVLEALRIEAQNYIDNAKQHNTVKYNRTIDQLEFTIESVEQKINELTNEPSA